MKLTLQSSAEPSVTVELVIVTLRSFSLTILTLCARLQRALSLCLRHSDEFEDGHSGWRHSARHCSSEKQGLATSCMLAIEMEIQHRSISRKCSLLACFIAIAAGHAILKNRSAPNNIFSCRAQQVGIYAGSAARAWMPLQHNERRRGTRGKFKFLIL